MKRVLITMMLAGLMAGIPVIAGPRNIENRTGARSMAVTYFPEPAVPQYRPYYRRRHRRRVRYVFRRRHYRPHYRRHYRRIYYRRRRY